MRLKTNSHFRPDLKTKGYALDLDVSPNGEILASSYTRYGEEGEDSLIIIWELSDGREPKIREELDGGSLGSRTLRFSPDGLYLAYGQYGHVKIRDMESGETRELTTPTYLTTEVVRFSKDGSRLFVAQGEYIYACDLTTFEVATSFERKHRESILTMSLSPDEVFLSSAGIQPYNRVWKVATGKQLKRISCHTANVEAVAFSPKGDLLASGGGDSRIILRQVGKKWPELQKFEGHTLPVTALDFSSDGALLASGSGRGDSNDGVRLWDVDTGAEVARLALPPGAGFVETVCFFGDDRRLAVALWKGDVYLIDIVS